MYNKISTLVFDMDGVITSENKYWNTARLTVWDLISSENYLGLSNYFDNDDFLSRFPLVSGKVISSSFIYELKRRAVNSNWDLTFFVVSLHLLAILKEFKASNPDTWHTFINSNSLPLEEELKQLGKLLREKDYNSQISNTLIERFWAETISLTGNDVINYISSFSRKTLDTDLAYLQPKGDLWQLCYRNFQEWYETKGHNVLVDDDTILDLQSIGTLLKDLRDRGKYTLGIATGRPRNEVIQPMSRLGLLQYFDQKRIVTYDEVLYAESIMSRAGSNVKLSKPHPFVVLKAIYPDEDIEVLATEKSQCLDCKYAAYIGDAASDVVAAKRAGCVAIGVLTGVVGGKVTDSQQKMLKDVGCDSILNSVLELPMLLGI